MIPEPKTEIIRRESPAPNAANPELAAKLDAIHLALGQIANELRNAKPLSANLCERARLTNFVDDINAIRDCLETLILLNRK